MSAIIAGPAKARLGFHHHAIHSSCTRPPSPRLSVASAPPPRLLLPPTDWPPAVDRASTRAPTSLRRQRRQGTHDTPRPVSAAVLNEDHRPIVMPQSLHRTVPPESRHHATASLPSPNLAVGGAFLPDAHSGCRLLSETRRSTSHAEEKLHHHLPGRPLASSG